MIEARSAAELGQALEEIGLLPMVRTRTTELAWSALEALVEGGAYVVEVTLGVPDAPRLIHEFGRRHRGSAIVGAGTVRSAHDAELCADAGARFLVAPGFDAETMRFARARDLAVLPGALTPSEIMHVSAHGATLVKVFPCFALGGPSYLRTLRAPLPELRLMPSGGVRLDNVAEYIAAGASALGVAGELVDEEALAAGRARNISERAAAFLAAIRAARAAAG